MFSFGHPQDRNCPSLIRAPRSHGIVEDIAFTCYAMNESYDNEDDENDEDYDVYGDY